MWIVFKGGLIMSAESIAIVGEFIHLIDNEYDKRYFSISQVKYILHDDPLKTLPDGTACVNIKQTDVRRSERYHHIGLS